MDIAPAAIARAKTKHPDMVDKLDFWAHDLCGGTLVLHNVHCFVDRGCFHQVPPGDVRAYVRNIVAIAAPDARLLLFVKAFRDKTVQCNTQEKDEILKRIQRAFSPPFRVVRVAETNLGSLAPDGSRDPPGLVFWRSLWQSSDAMRVKPRMRHSTGAGSGHG